jgi:hypothetical protein
MSTKCDHCMDGWILKNSIVRPCRCAAERKIAARLPEKYRAAKLDDFQRDVSEVVREWIRQPSAGLFIFGGVGRGKTHLASGIFRYLVEAWTHVVFQRCAKFYEDVRETFRTNSSEGAVLNPLERVRFLIFDDLGAGKLSDYERRLALELIEQRINSNRPTVVTTNWSLDQISELMDDRIASRLSLFTQLKLTGEDLRERESGVPIIVKPALCKEIGEEPMTESRQHELAQITAALKRGLGLSLENGRGRTQRPTERLAELQRQKQIILARYSAQQANHGD